MDTRIEIMQALLHDAIVSKEAFSAIATIFDDVSGDDTTAWEDYKAKFGVEDDTTDDTTT